MSNSKDGLAVPPAANDDSGELFVEALEPPEVDAPTAPVQLVAERFEPVPDAPEGVYEEVNEVEILEERVVASPSALEGALGAARRGPEEAARARIALYERELEALGSDADKGRIALYQHEIGELTESQLGDEGAAVKAYGRALAADATLQPNLWAIRRIFERRGLWPNLQKLLDVEIRFAHTAEQRAELLWEKGQLLEDRLQNSSGALDCFNKAVEVSPHSLPAWMALEKLYSRQGDKEGLLRVYGGLCAATAEPARKVALLLDRAQLSWSDTASAPAEALFREALSLGVDGDGVLEVWERLAEKSGDPTALTTVLEARLARLATPERPVADRLLVRRRLAALASARGEPERALAHLQEALAVAPGEPLILRELAELAERLGRFEELAEYLTMLLASAPSAWRVGLRLERASALRRAGQIEAAEAALAEVAGEEPKHLGVLVARERNALAARDWATLAQLYRTEAEMAEAVPDARWAATALLQAAAALTHLGRDAEAQELLTAALVKEPHFAPAAAALERLYLRNRQTGDYVALLESELSVGPSEARAERLFEALIGAQEALGDLPAAAAATRRWLERRSDDVRSWMRLYQFEREAGLLREAAEDLRQLATRVGEDRRVAVLFERADLLEHRVGDLAAAAEAYREVLRVRPGERAAATAFERIARRQAVATHGMGAAAWDELAAVLRQEIESSPGPERTAQALLELGALQEEERRDFAEAAKTYRQLLMEEPRNGAALRGLERACRALGDSRGRAEALEQEIEGLAPEARGEAWVRLGEIYEEDLEDSDRADTSYEQALTTPATEMHAALGRLRTAVRSGEPLRMAAALARLGRADAALGDEEAALLLAGGEVTAAVARTEEVLALDPAALLPRWRKVRLAAGRGDLAALAEALAELAPHVDEVRLKAALWRRSGLLALGSARAEEAIQRLRQTLALVPDDPASLVVLAALTAEPTLLAARAAVAAPEAQSDWLLEQAEALEAEGRREEAAQVAMRALTSDPDHLPALELVRRLALWGGDEAGYAAATVQWAALLRDNGRAAAALAEAASCYERLGRRAEAAGTWRAALDRLPLESKAFSRARALMRELYAEEEEPGPLVELYGHQLLYVREAGERVQLLLERASLLADEGDDRGAERDLRAVLDLEARNTEALWRLASLLATRGAGRDEAIALFERYLARIGDRSQRRAALLRLAELEEAAARSEAAVERLTEAIALAPTPEATLGEHERLATLFTREQQWSRAIPVLQRLAALCLNGPERARVELRLAAISADALADSRAAADALLRALTADPLAIEALARLLPLHEAGYVLPLELEEKLEQTINAARAVARAQPSAPAAYATLAQVWAWRGDEGARQRAAQAEALARGQVPPPAPVDEPKKELAPGSWEALLLPETAQAVALEVWRALPETVSALFDPPLESLGIGKRDRVNGKGVPSAWLAVDKIARSLLGSHTSYELYIASRPEDCLASGGALLCGSAFAEQLTPTQSFRLARQVALWRDRLGALEKLDDDALALFFAACAEVADLPLPPGLAGVDRRQVEERSRQLLRVMPRKERKALQAIGARLSSLPAPQEWRRAVLQGAARAGLVVVGDLGVALSELGWALDEQRGQALCTFALSDACQALRRELGFQG